jgi:hypothetical protein
LTRLEPALTMIAMKTGSFRLLLLALVVLIACSSPITPDAQTAPAAMPEGLLTQRSGLWATKVFATFPTFVDEAPPGETSSMETPSSVQGLTPEQPVIEGQSMGTTPNPIMSECAGIAWFSDGSTKSTPFLPCPSTLFDFFDGLKSWLPR